MTWAVYAPQGDEIAQVYVPILTFKSASGMLLIGIITAQWEGMGM